MKTYFRILSYSGNYKGAIFFNLLFTICFVVFAGVSIPAIQPLLDLIFKGEELPQEATLPPFSLDINYFVDLINYLLIMELQPAGRQEALVYVIIFIIFLRLLGNIFFYLANVFMTIIRTKTIEDLRAHLFSNMIMLPIGYFEGEKKGDIMTRITSDVNEVENSVVTTFESIFRDPFTIIFYIALMMMISLPLTLFVFIILPFSAVIITWISRSLKKDAYNAQGKYGELMSLLEETISGMRIVKAFGAENYLRTGFGKFNSFYSKLNRKQFYKKKIVPPFSEMAGVITIGVILWYGGGLVFDGAMEASSFIVFIILFSQIIKPAKKFSGAFSSIYKGIASGERIFQLMDNAPVVKEPAKPKRINNLHEGIFMRNVSFSYSQDKPVLKNIDLEIPKGSIVALAGPSGSGKSTLAELLLRFYDPVDGKILIDGHDIREYKVADLRGLMGLVSQEPILFNDTIYNNIAFGMDHVSEDKVIEAAKAANAHDFIVRQQHGYDTNIGDGGRLLSGGQRQRVSIARALLKNPDFLILDEATSSLDSDSEKAVQDALYRLLENRTCLIIAHRLSTIKDADKVVVLREGEIVQQGTHQELVSTSGLYQTLYHQQE